MDTQTISQFDIYRLRKLIQQALQLPDGAVIGGWLPENPLSAFITVDLMTSREFGVAYRTFNGEQERICSTIESTVSISCYGENGVAMATKLRTLLQSSAISDRLRAEKMGLPRLSAVRNLTATVGVDYQERGQFDCVFSHHHIIDTPLSPIEKVEHISLQ